MCECVSVCVRELCVCESYVCVSVNVCVSVCERESCVCECECVCELCV